MRGFVMRGPGPSRGGGRVAEVVLPLMALPVVAVLAGGCGAAAHGGVRATGTTAGSETPPASTGPRRFTACMRAHGVRTFPMPDSAGGFDLGGIDTSSSTYQAALRTCARLLADLGGGA